MNLGYEDRLELSEFLLSLSLGEPQHESCGICSNLCRSFDRGHVHKWFAIAAEAGIYGGWEHYSGDYGFPVPGPEEYASHAWPAMSAYLDRIPKWDRDTEYGRMRRDLARYLSVAVLTWGLK